MVVQASGGACPLDSLNAMNLSAAGQDYLKVPKQPHHNSNSPQQSHNQVLPTGHWIGRCTCGPSKHPRARTAQEQHLS